MRTFSTLSLALVSMVALSAAACSGGAPTAGSAQQMDTQSTSVPTSDLPAIPSVNVSILSEVNLNRDFVGIEGREILVLHGAPRLNENMTLTLAVSGSNADTVTIPIATSQSQGDVLSALSDALQKLGYEGQSVFQQDDMTKYMITKPKPGAPTRPAAKRDLNDLGVVFQSVAMVEQVQQNSPNQAFVGSLNDGPTETAEDGHLGPQHNAAFTAISSNLKDFIQFSPDSLTQHEAQTIGLGLGLIQNSSEAGATFRSGDRVQVQVTDANGAVTVTSGIVMEASSSAQGDVAEVLAVSSANQYVDLVTDGSKVIVMGLVASGLVDSF